MSILDKHVRENKLKILAPVAVATMAAFTNISVAAEDGRNLTQLEEVIVTARKRSESIQDIPQAITAFTAADVENIGISRIKDIVDLTPNIILQQSFRMGVVNLSSRGLTTPQQGDSSMVVNFDGVQAPAQDFINQDLFDIERIEVLKGPQSALYGAGAIAGAINIVTKKPTNEFEGFAKLKLGNENAQRAVAGISGPIVEDKLFFRLAGVYNNRDGYTRNAFTGDSLDYLDETVVRGALYADLDDLRIDFRASVADTEAGASYFESFPFITEPFSQIGLFGGPAGRLGSDISQAQYVNYSNVPTEEKINITNVSLKVEKDIGEGVLTSVTGYNDSDQEDFGDLDFQLGDVLLQDVRFDVEVFNQELRYTSDDSGAFRWVGGVFYQEREIFNQVLTVLGDFTSTIRTVEESRNNPANLVVTDSRDLFDSTAWGVFFSSDYDLSDKLVLTTALRYDEVDMDTAYVGDSAAFQALPGVNSSRTFDEWQPKVTLAYTLSDNTLLYANVARGFRSGAANATSAFAGGLPRFIEPEVADTIELGFKSTFLDNRLSLNGAIFHSDIENRHHYFFGASLQSMTTFAEAEVDGIELDMVAILADGIQLSASVGIMSAEITSDEITEYLAEFPGAVPLGDVVLSVSNRGNTLPDTPESTFNLALSYDRPLFGDVNLYGRIAYKYIDEIFFDTENFIDNGGAADFVDLRLGLRSEDWGITAFVDNATDERTYSNYAFSGFQGNYLPNTPRIYGIELSYRF